MIIDIDTSLHFIKNKFAGYIDESNIVHIPVNEHNYKFNNEAWHATLYVNNITNSDIIKNKNVNVTDFTYICMWNHHNMTDIGIQNSFLRRCKHMLTLLTTAPQTMLLCYIEKTAKIYYNGL